MPEELRAEVAAVVPAAYATTSWGTPALDLGAGVRAQLAAAGVAVVDVGGCTREDADPALLPPRRRRGRPAGRRRVEDRVMSRRDELAANLEAVRGRIAGGLRRGRPRPPTTCASSW